MNTYEYNDNAIEMLYDTLDALSIMMEGDKEFTTKEILNEMEEIARCE